MCQGMEACQQPSERAQTWLLQPHGSLEMILDPAESWTATSRETLSQNHPAEPLPDSIPSESITLLENSSREFTCSALLLHLVLKRFIIGPTLQEEFAMTETTSLKEGMDKGWPSASQHKRPQKPGHASALSSDFQPTERACNIVYAEKAVEETNEFLIKIEEYKRPNLQYSCREPRLQCDLAWHFFVSYFLQF
ncbi:uncharacterized protein LOC122200052 isoform X2 [Panthera leo]|uniref:uncharacterized protein LOC122200052 isoform X2 n=1 Tax=Panthera leo TaxID=9689 RepID=UPI001C6A5DF4|nr:uncharacterized protein LOC122200052 isoform X2 [Panthera leo]